VLKLRSWQNEQNQDRVEQVFKAINDFRVIANLRYSSVNQPVLNIFKLGYMQGEFL